MSNEIRNLRQDEEEWDRFFNLSQDLLCIAGFDGYFKRLNAAWVRTLGYTEEELTNKPFLDFVHEDDRAATIAKSAEVTSGGQAIRFENRYRCKDGSYRWLSWNATPAPDMTRFFAAARDVTEQKQAQQEIEELNRSLRAQTIQLEVANKELEAFAYSVSHDLRAPLRGIDGFSQALIEDYHDKFDETGKDYLKRVRTASQRMATLIGDLLKLSKVTRNEMRRKQINLSDLAREVASELQKLHPIRTVKWVVCDRLAADGDPHLIRVALDNLLGNAWKFTSKRTEATIEFGSVGHDGTTAYFVRDNGAGFDMKYADRLFAPFQRLHPVQEFDGTGIGLATVQRIIHRHGGRLWAEAEVDKGATFYFTL